MTCGVVAGMPLDELSELVEDRERLVGLSGGREEVRRVGERGRLALDVAERSPRVGGRETRRGIGRGQVEDALALQAGCADRRIVDPLERELDVTACYRPEVGVLRPPADRAGQPRVGLRVGVSRPVEQGEDVRRLAVEGAPTVAL